VIFSVMAIKKDLKKKKTKKREASLHHGTKKGIIVVLCFTFALISILSYFNKAGIFGFYFLKISKILFGRGFFLIPLGFILGALAVIKSFRKPVYKFTILGIGLFILSILGIFYILGQPGDWQTTGGVLGLFFGFPGMKLLGFWASLIILLALIFISILIIFDIRLLEKVKEKEGEKIEEEKAPKDILEFPETKESKEKSKKEPGILEKVRDKIKKVKPKTKLKEIKIPQKQPDNKQTAGFLKEYNSFSKRKTKGFKLPPLKLLDTDVGKPVSGDIKANTNIIKRTLGNFGIEVEMAEVNVGPTVTQYTLRPAQGVRLSRITALTNDLSLALAAHPIRIEAPIPGRSLVGIEIPNKSSTFVRLGNLFKDSVFKNSPSPLLFALGRDVRGFPVFTDLSLMPHLLIAGATGTGKTICLNSLILSLLFRNSPDILKLILVDPKRVEFSFYNNIPHLLSPVITNADRTINVLRWAVTEMEKRFEILREARTRDIISYNNFQLKNNSFSEFMPYLVIIIDELADLMAAKGREVEAAIVRLAQMARAVGIHLVVATQRPSVEVITGLIKANITARIAFQVASQIDSRTILDMAGAEKLLGSGDMLYLSPDSPKPRRIQGCFVSEKEVKRVVKYLKKQAEPDYREEIISSVEPEVISSVSVKEKEFEDELYEEAKKLVIETKKASASLLQRRLRIGYARAARLLDMMEEEGIVGPPEGSKPRDVYVDKRDEEESV